MKQLSSEIHTKVQELNALIKKANEGNLNVFIHQSPYGGVGIEKPNALVTVRCSLEIIFNPLTKTKGKIINDCPDIPFDELDD